MELEEEVGICEILDEVHEHGDELDSLPELVPFKS